MKNSKNYLVQLLTFVVLITAVGAFSSCKKGADDPVVSLTSRKDRFTNTWTLNKYEKDGTNQDVSGSTFTYTVYKNGNLTETIEGSVFGVPSRTVRDGTWVFINDDEDVRVTFDNEEITYNIQRLASKELWLKRLKDNQTHTYYFDGL